MIETKYRVIGMDCGSCATKVETAVKRLPGVAHVSVSATTGRMTVMHEQDEVLIDKLKRNLRALGYGVFPASFPGVAPGDEHGTHGGDSAAAGGHKHFEHGPETTPWRSPQAVLIGVCTAALAMAYIMGKLAPAYETVIFLLALAVGLIPVASRAIAAARAGSPFTIESLMTVAAVGAVLIGATEEAAVVLLLFLIGEWLEGLAANRARNSIRALMSLVPKNALVEVNGEAKETPIILIPIGAIILVRPGDRIAADGEILEGASVIDEAPITGESVGVAKKTGDAVFAGTINHEAVIRVKVTATSEDNTISRVVKLVEEAQESKAPAERFIDRFARYYTPAVFAAGLAVAIAPPLLEGAEWNEWIYKGLAILLIGCPCALVISVPAAIASGLSAGARRGILIKGGAILERAGKVNAAAFDKTGTLTVGKPVVTDVRAFGIPERQALALAAALETGSSHPVAFAILDHAKKVGAPNRPAADVTLLAGRGMAGRVGGRNVLLVSPRAAAERDPISAEIQSVVTSLQEEGKTVSLLLVDGDVAGLFAIRDEPRADAMDGLQRLREHGVEPMMLTGDNARTAAAIASSLGVTHRAEMLPADKQEIVRELQRDARIVLKVGDGVNDAPALAAADIGVAMGGGTDVALETADAAILHGRVLDVAHLVELSRATMRNIRQNVTIALGLKGVFLVTTLLGVTGLWPAIMADTGATVLVTMNAMRLLAWRPTS